MRLKKVLITGFTGQVGSILADYLLTKKNIEIYGMMRWQDDLENINHLIPIINTKKKIFLSYADLNDFASIDSMISKILPDYIFHLAAQSFPRTSFDIPIETLNTNIIGTCNLLESIKHNISKKKFFNPIIHVCSSSEVYGRAKLKSGIKISEETPLHGSSPYSISKIGADFLGRYYAEAYNLKTFITRMGTHSGRRRSDVFFESTVAKQIAMIENDMQKPIIYVGNLESVRTYQDSRDAVIAYYKLAKAFEKNNIPKGEVFNIAGKEVYKLSEIINILLSFSKIKNISIKVDKNRLRPIDANYQMFDSKKIHQFIDWEPKISVRSMLLDLLNYWRAKIVNNGYTPINR